MKHLILGTVRNTARHGRSTLVPWCMTLCAAVVLTASTAIAQPAVVARSGTHAEEQLAQAKRLMDTDPDSALVLAREIVDHLPEQGSAEQKAHALMLLGEALQATGDAPAAMATYHRAQLLTEAALEKQAGDPQLVLLRSDIQMLIGLLHFSLHNFDESVARYNDALRILDAAQGALPEEELNSRKVRAFNNIAGVYIQRGDYATALPYFQQAVEINRPLNNLRNESALNNNIGICLMETGKHEKADEYFLRALAVRKQTGDVAGQAQVLNNLGKNQAVVGQFKAARDRFEQALALGRSADNRVSMAISLESLSSAYDTLGDYKAALAAFREFKALNDSLYNAESRTTIARLEDEFRRDKEKKVFALEAQRKDAVNARQRIWNFALAIALLSILLIAYLLFKVMRGRVRNSALKQETLRLQSEKLEAEQAKLKEELEFKERELTANALFLLKKNELIAHIAARLLKARSTFRQENQKIVQDIVRDLQDSQDEHNWNEFEAHFTRVHSTFYQTLQERFPALTPNERKLCAFLRLNMSTKDISAITQQSLNSITVARSRLRKKLQIEGEDVQLVDFLLSI